MENQEKDFTANDPAVAGISRKTIKNIIKAWQETGNELTKIRPNVSKKDRELLFHLISESLKEGGGEISKQAKIVHLAMIYINLSKTGKKNFLELLASGFDIDIQELDKRIHTYQDATNDKELAKAETNLRNALVAPRVNFLRQLITLPNGFIFLKDMRENVLEFSKTEPKLRKLGDDIKNLLTTYFDVNLLDLQEITWNSPAVMLERLMEYEAVHDITSWKELKHRLHTDHRVFAFFHYKMPDEPLIFVEVALVNGMSNNIQKLINVKERPGDPHKADTAIFYSISSTQRGLDGISFGNFLIKRVVKRIASEFDNIKTFATLSPIPMFLNWLFPYLNTGGNNLMKPDEEQKIQNISGNENSSFALIELLKKNNWHKEKEITDTIKKPLMRLCAHYLFNIKQKNSFRAFDPVANFHLSNGAKIEHIHWLADISKKGIQQSAGIMLNYHYRPDKIALNHENYMSTGSIHASSDAKSWLS